jgi:hypothetical protein
LNFAPAHAVVVWHDAQSVGNWAAEWLGFVVVL